MLLPEIKGGLPDVVGRLLNLGMMNDELRMGIDKVFKYLRRKIE